jgi:hypothetical protein
LLCVARVTIAQSIITKVNKSLYVTIDTNSFQKTQQLAYHPFGSPGKYIIVKELFTKLACIEVLNIANNNMVR